MDESEFKTRICKILRGEGGYGRRIEDQYAVGIPDCILIPRGGPVFFVEAKIMRTQNWGATPRQLLELQNIRAAAGEHAVACEMGYNKENNTITLRRIEDPSTMWCHRVVSGWSNFSVTSFLQFCIRTWSEHDAF